MYFLENAEPIYEKGWFITMGILIGLLVLPWIFIIFKYWIFRKLRVRYILSNGRELKPMYYKKGSDIVIPETEYHVIWYTDAEMTIVYTPIKMPDYNIKLYGKVEDNE